jgi:Methyltransferase small domain
LLANPAYPVKLTTMDIVLFIFLVLIAAIGISLVVWSIKNGISPMPTSPKVKAGMFSLLPADFRGKIYELGSGWGTLAIPLAKKFPLCQIVGFETSPIPFWVSKLWVKAVGFSNVTLQRRDFFSVDLSDASLVVCYLYPGAMNRLKAKFERELKPGTLVVSNTFAVPGWAFEKVLEVDDLYRTKIYFYKINKSSASSI